MDTETIKKLFDERKVNFNIIHSLKKEQIDVAVSISNNRDCVAFLPTGYGKTLCFLINFVIKEEPSIVIVVSPLISLMDSQICTLKNFKISCIRLSSDLTDHEYDGVVSGKYSFIFASPEAILNTRWRRTFTTNAWQTMVSLIVFDEAHCISEWGEDFRPDYMDVSVLKSFFKVPVLCLTATSTKNVRADIMNTLQLEDANTDIVYKSPNRPNIFISCRKRVNTDYAVELEWLINHIKRKGVNSKKIIFYCRSIDRVSELFLLTKQLLGQFAYVGGIKSPDNLLVEMYHKCTHDSSKQRIIKDFSSKNSRIRCLFATVALGMGIDITDVDLVVHIGCPASVISYWQETGRCARDGRQGHSLILYDNFTASLKHTEKTMASIVKNSDTNCVRKAVLEHFFVKDNETYDSAVCVGCIDFVCQCQACLCCTLCAKKCKCSERGVIDFDSFIS